MYDSNMQHTEWGIDPDIRDSVKVADQAKGIDTIIETAIPTPIIGMKAMVFMLCRAREPENLK